MSAFIVLLSIGIYFIISTLFRMLFSWAFLKVQFHFKKVLVSQEIQGNRIAVYLARLYGIDLPVFLGDSDYYQNSNNGVHYVSLSHEVFHGSNVTAYAVGLHEVGHAIQKKEGGFLEVARKKFFYPPINFGFWGLITLLIASIGNLTPFYSFPIILFGLLFLQHSITIFHEAQASIKAIHGLWLMKKNKEVKLEKKHLIGVSIVLAFALMTYVSKALVEPFSFICNEKMVKKETKII